MLVAKSRITGGRPLTGTPAQNGLVPKRASAPPYGATMPREMTLTKWIDTSPAAAACSAQAPMRPRWCELPSATMQLPCCLRAGDAQRHRLGADHLAEAGVAVQPQQRAGVAAPSSRARSA